MEDIICALKKHVLIFLEDGVVLEGYLEEVGKKYFKLIEYNNNIVLAQTENIKLIRIPNTVNVSIPNKQNEDIPKKIDQDENKSDMKSRIEQVAKKSKSNEFSTPLSAGLILNDLE